MEMDVVPLVKLKEFIVVMELENRMKNAMMVII
jgi:hypothetical protein